MISWSNDFSTSKSKMFEYIFLIGTVSHDVMIGNIIASSRAEN